VKPNNLILSSAEDTARTARLQAASDRQTSRVVCETTILSAAVQKTAAILANVVRAVAVNVVSDAVLPKLLEP